MKKLFASILVFACLTVSAQDIDTSFQFVDESGNIIENGSEITVKGLTPAETEWDDPYIDSGLSVVNTTGEEAFVGLTLSVTKIDNGSLSCCFPNNCYMASNVIDEYDNGAAPMEANGNQLFLTEYYPSTYGTCTATFQLRVHEAGMLGAGELKAYGPSVTVNFVYDETSAGIGSVSADESQVVGIYTLDGKPLDAPTKGVNVVKYADGHTVKTIYK